MRQTNEFFFFVLYLSWLSWQMQNSFSEWIIIIIISIYPNGIIIIYEMTPSTVKSKLDRNRRQCLVNIHKERERKIIKWDWRSTRKNYDEAAKKNEKKKFITRHDQSFYWIFHIMKMSINVRMKVFQKKNNHDDDDDDDYDFKMINILFFS